MEEFLNMLNLLERIKYGINATNLVLTEDSKASPGMDFVIFCRGITVC